MESFMFYISNVTIFSCCLFLLFAFVEYLGTKIEKLVTNRKKTEKNIIKKRVNDEKHFYNFIIE